MAFSSTASFGGAGFRIGGDPTNVLGRWDLGWITGTSYAVGRRINANGCSYVCYTTGTTGGVDPTASWSTQEGTFVTDGAVFLCQRKPLDGESIQAVVEIETDTLVGNVSPLISLIYRDTAGTDYQTALSDVALDGSEGVAGNRLPPFMRFVSYPLVLPNSNIRYLCVAVAGYGENGSSANIRVAAAYALNLSVSASV